MNGFAQSGDSAPRAVPHGAVLQARELGFSYPVRHVFNGFSADFGAGLSWVRGRNGSGKSTLLRLLGGALPLRSGSLKVQGIDFVQQPIAYRREVFWCGSGSIAFDHLRPPEYFGFLRGLYPRFDVDVDALHEHLDSFGLTPHLALRLAALSTGTQRKVWLAAALAVNASAVLIDEPVNALDAASLAYLYGVLQRCAADSARAWVVTSHESLGAAGAQAALLDLSAPDVLQHWRID